MKRWIALAAFGAAGLLGACRTAAPGAVETTWVVVETTPDDSVDLAHARVEGAGVRSATFMDSRLAVELSSRERTGIVIRAEGGCTIRLSTNERAAGGTVRRTMVPWFDFGAPRAQLGFGARLEIATKTGCAEANAVKITWDASGSTLGNIRPSPDGHRFAATLPSLDRMLGPSLPWGVVPIAPRTRGEVELVASWTDDEGRRVARTVRASAAARARGLPNVTIGARLYLGGDGWRVESSPPSARATIDVIGGHATLAPDARGTWALADGTGKTLRLVAGKYDETPLDCGRSECHAAISASSLSNPMTTILERGLDAPFGGDYPGCALGCHAEGEPGLDDGGFAAVARALGHGVRDATRNGFHELAAPLRRLGGVGCLACHGPGAIPEASARYGILRADVCATCHDAPPRYGHVEAWRTSRMARADVAPRTSEPGCARCHTTWGFLGQEARRPPTEIGPVGITCAACHSVHPVREESAGVVVGRTCSESLRRDLAVPALLEGALTAKADRGRVCLSCHAPNTDDRAPQATAAAIWTARGGLDPFTGAPLSGPSPHAGIDGGCVGCHNAGPAGLARGEGHAFQARRDGCATCHAGTAKATAGASLRARAWAIFVRLNPTVSTTPVDGSAPLHAANTRYDLKTPLGRAAWDVAMVLEDPAADAHNAPYSRALLDAAENALAGVRIPGGRGP